MYKLKQLIKEWPKRSIRLASNLNEIGYPADLLLKYVKSGWLESLGYGAYKLSGDRVDWYGALAALQEQKKLNIHPGGKTALILKGYAHYLGTLLNHVDLFGSKADKLPKWFIDYKWDASIMYMQTKLFNFESTEFFSVVEIDSVKFKISSPELASMEMLNLIPKGQSFDEAAKITEGLTSLRQELVQQLLEKCNSVKVKRLFLYLAEKNEHQWLRGLNLGNINLGHGKRSVVENGIFDKKYKITVPRE
jgi:hypothetical protein